MNISSVDLKSVKTVTDNMAAIVGRAMHRTFRTDRPFEDYMTDYRTISMIALNREPYWIRQAYTRMITYLLGYATKNKLVYKADTPEAQTIMAPDFILEQLHNGETIYTDCKSLTCLMVFLSVCIAEYTNSPNNPLERFDLAYGGFELIRYPKHNQYSHVVALLPTAFTEQQQQYLRFDLAHAIQCVQIGWFIDTPPAQCKDLFYHFYLPSNLTYGYGYYEEFDVPVWEHIKTVTYDC